MESPESSSPDLFSTLCTLVQSYGSTKQLPDISNDLWEIMDDQAEPFLFRVSLIDQLIAKHAGYDALHEIIFDLFLVKFLAAENKTEQFFDSEEWEHIESKTLDRGTEMLNLFLYLSEAKETEVEVTLEDFLNEFLLVDEDEFQDEYSIYEPFIENPELLEADFASIRNLQQELTPEHLLKDIFVPIVLFFQEAEGISEPGKLPIGEISSFEASVLASLLHFYES